MSEVDLSVDEPKKAKRKKPFVGYYKIWVMLTYLSVVSALVGMSFAVGGNIVLAIICLMTCGLCDMLDGPVARRKKRTEREKNYGIEIDALADLISFGVFPVVIGYAVGFGTLFQNNDILRLIIGIAIAAFFVLAALIRLAYFNAVEIELQQKNEKRKFYVGMPVTFVSIVIPLVYTVCFIISASFASVYPAMLFIIALAFLSRIKFPKIKGRYLVVFLLVGLPLAVFLIWSIGARG